MKQVSCCLFKDFTALSLRWDSHQNAAAKEDTAECEQEKLRLDMDDEAAVEWMQQLLNESATALMPQIMETTHKVCRH